MLCEMTDYKVTRGGSKTAQQRIPIMTCNSGRAKDAIQTDETVEDMVQEKESRYTGPAAAYLKLERGRKQANINL